MKAYDLMKTLWNQGVGRPETTNYFDTGAQIFGKEYFVVMVEKPNGNLEAAVFKAVAKFIVDPRLADEEVSETVMSVLRQIHVRPKFTEYGLVPPREPQAARE